MEELIKAVANSGAKVIVSGAAVGEMALHFCERYKYISFLHCVFLLPLNISIYRGCGIVFGQIKVRLCAFHLLATLIMERLSGFFIAPITFVDSWF